MITRKRIGLYYESYTNLPALVIYIQNLVRTLKDAPDNEQPHIIILHRKDSPIDEIKNIGYLHLSFYSVKSTQLSLFARAVNKINRLLHLNFFIEKTDTEFPQDLDCVFPYSFQKEASYVKKKIIWKPDFQEIHLPLYFTAAELNYDREILKKINNENCELVFSSEDAQRDYLSLFPDNSKKIHLWKFTSYLPDFSQVNISELKRKYNFSENYFLVANQFWPHKNHLNVLKALKECLKHGRPCTIVFTGRQTSARDPELFQKLNFYSELHGLQSSIRFTGFIKREEQLALMKNALAVIQPSLFEGWSTVIEDCKAMNQFVIASNLSVNKEQISNRVAFFDPYDYKALAKHMMDCTNKEDKTPPTEYRLEIESFRKTILNTFNS